MKIRIRTGFGFVTGLDSYCVSNSLWFGFVSVRIRTGLDSYYFGFVLAVDSCWFGFVLVPICAGSDLYRNFWICAGSDLH